MSEGWEGGFGNEWIVKMSKPAKMVMYQEKEKELRILFIVFNNSNTMIKPERTVPVV